MGTRLYGLLTFDPLKLLKEGLTTIMGQARTRVLHILTSRGGRRSPRDRELDLGEAKSGGWRRPGD